jgi:MFS family permease
VSRQSFRHFLGLVAANGLFGNVVGLFLPIYFQRIGLTGLQSGVYFAFTAGAAILLSLPVGISTDRTSIVRILLLGLGLAAVNRLGLLFTEAFGWFCVFALLGSFGGRFFGTGIQALFFKLTGEDNRREAGLYMLANFVSSGLGLILGGWLVERFDFRVAFAFGVVSNVALMVMTRGLPRNETVTLALEEYKRALLQPNVLLLTAIFFLSSLHWGAEQTSYTPFLHDTLGLSLFSASLYAGLGFCLVGVGTYLGAILVERKLVKDLPALLGLGFLLAGVFHVLMCVRSVWLSFCFRGLHEIGDGFVFLVYYHGIAKVFKVEKIGGCAAFVSLFTAVGSLLGALLSGWLGGKYGPEWPLILSGVVLALTPALLRLKDAGFEGEYERV